ncbi:BamA/TamA family outer membrane protein [Mucilaginibacter robiniae]|uniref:BamA/TamA family outer membrane protein n=1 Tax=Mucilaginibacter robiniae TaxID=2728022 RepID=A0A7L5E1J4_9SPHI|nr:BamA/TamA family outer membrane protein [Mucilaginibacter robiniae]QJD97045.1 BamA/TamA family outer membrane protein [Mucilaginibacter robiniae]
MILNRYLTKTFVLITGLFSLYTATAQSQTHKDSVTLAIDADYNKVGAVHRKLFGENYRKLWAVPVKMRVMHLQQEKGGLTVLEKGGGLQTQSLRLRDPSGQEWVLRSVQKYPERALPPKLRPTIAKAILQDQISTSNPFGALTVPPLAEALDIPHANPEIVYVGDDAGLGKYREKYKNSIYLFEEREPEESEKTDNTHKVQKKLFEDNDVKVDQKIVLRARLLDMIIGDWDRHDDQWRWDKYKDDKAITYTPIPRDRDQVYYKTSGVFPWFVSHQWLKAKFQPYRDEIRDINSWNYNARYFDRLFLNEMSEADWKEQIAYVQAHLTDEVINRAIHKMPPAIFALSGPQIIQTIKARRSNIAWQGLQFYSFLSRYVDVPTSEKHERVDVTEQADGKVNLVIHKVKKDSSLAQITYQRVFDPKDTKEVRVYGMGGHDAFSVAGSGKSPIKVRLIGGEKADSFYVDKQVDNKKNLYIYDRSDEKNVLPERSQAKIHTEADTDVIAYDRKNFLYNRFQPLIAVSYNTDYGITPTLGFAYTKEGFRKLPFAYRHQLEISYLSGRKAFLIHYNAEYTKLIGNNDFLINFTSRGPHNYSNFFGIGNNTEFVDQKNNIRYFRNRYDYLYGDVRLRHTYGDWKVSGGLTGQFYHSTSENNEPRFLGAYNQQHPDEQVFSNKSYAGLVAGALLDTRNNTLRTTKGVYWNTTISGLQQLNQDHSRYSQLVSQFSFYANPDRDSILIIAARFGAGTTLGHADYFQQLKLGGSDNLRGFRTWRFTGRSMLFNNLEMRLKVLDINSYLFPGSIGIIGFNDVGRVFTPGESSSKWHDGYGGGIYVEPADLVLLQATLGKSNEGHIVYINLGYRF